ncbi:MAG: carboxylate--amine ligase [Chloroflexi bacterium]|nr:carboxylate--amine ligase [Chloroflexota bacterium]MCI0648544.1 carboxylate--amine ligase [Chloroflexota bacterium]MCI0727307.1 carboxylate--amine ligase [Chloroflexota bacterium]
MNLIAGNQPPPAIVIGLDSLPGIQAARILAGRGIPVLAIARRPDHYCCRTNVCQQILLADTQNGAFIQTLLALGARLPQKAVLFPCTDMAVWHVSHSRQLLEPCYYVMLPEHNVVETLMDKVKFYTYAQRERLPLPRTFFLHNRAEAEAAAAALAYPAVLKPALRTPAWTTHSEHKVYQVANATELLAVYDRCARWTETLVAQEWIAGPDANLFSCNCYFDAAGRPPVTFVARKLRQWPPQVGVSCLGQECRNDVVRETAVRLFEKAGYYGLGYLEMKQDKRTGEQFIMEANVGRPTVRSAIAEAGGVELLYTAYCDAVGWPLPAEREQQYRGVKWVHWHYDLRSAFYYWRRGELSLAEWWRSWRGRKVDAIFSWRDPVPFAADIAITIGRLLARGK